MKWRFKPQGDHTRLTVHLPLTFGSKEQWETAKTVERYFNVQGCYPKLWLGNFAVISYLVSSVK